MTGLLQGQPPTNSLSTKFQKIFYEISIKVLNLWGNFELIIILDKLHILQLFYKKIRWVGDAYPIPPGSSQYLLEILSI